uniref:Major intrinsically disordered Notch2-binding receptor 1-like C-terminal domain-containing protein n=1 Tax=Eptatretus burgeri TaxID=7764 RepID=A0A8C4Q5A1_EPTBU
MDSRRDLMVSSKQGGVHPAMGVRAPHPPCCCAFPPTESSVMYPGDLNTLPKCGPRGPSICSPAAHVSRGELPQANVAPSSRTPAEVAIPHRWLTPQGAHPTVCSKSCGCPVQQKPANDRVSRGGISTVCLPWEEERYHSFPTGAISTLDSSTRRLAFPAVAGATRARSLREEPSERVQPLARVRKGGGAMIYGTCKSEPSRIGSDQAQALRKLDSDACSSGYVSGSGRSHGRDMGNTEPKAVQVGTPLGVNLRRAASAATSGAHMFGSLEDCHPIKASDSVHSIGVQTDIKSVDVDSQRSSMDEEALDGIRDDISDIFRFLDDVSVCGSATGPMPSRNDSSASLARPLHSDSDGTPDRVLRGRAPVAPSQDDELKANVNRLVLRIGEMERKLEDLSGVRAEISQVLAKLTHLDEKILHEVLQASSQSSQVPFLCIQCADVGYKNPGKSESGTEWGSSDASGGSVNESMRVRTLRRNAVSCPASHSLVERNGATEAEPPAQQRREWPDSTSGAREPSGRLGGRSCAGPGSSREYENRLRHGNMHLSPVQVRDEALLQKFYSGHISPAALNSRMKNNPLYHDAMPSSEEGQLWAQPSWTLEELSRKAKQRGKPVALDVTDSLNPNNLEYWMEEIYTPGYDTLLRRKEAEFRRAKLCKIATLVLVAVCTVVLVIVVPICTVRT